jgi:hypothetical protein
MYTSVHVILEPYEISGLYMYCRVTLVRRDGTAQNHVRTRLPPSHSHSHGRGLSGPLATASYPRSLTPGSLCEIAKTEHMDVGRSGGDSTFRINCTALTGMRDVRPALPTLHGEHRQHSGPYRQPSRPFGAGAELKFCRRQWRFGFDPRVAVLPCLVHHRCALGYQLGKRGEEREENIVEEPHLPSLERRRTPIAQHGDGQSACPFLVAHLKEFGLEVVHPTHVHRVESPRVAQIGDLQPRTRTRTHRGTVS